MFAAMKRSWWMAVARGVFTMLVGVVALLWPDIGLSVLLRGFGMHAIVNGVLAIAAAIAGREAAGSRWLLGAAGATGIGAGIITLVNPGITAITMLVLVATWALVSGVFEIAAAFAVRPRPVPAWLMALGGAFSVLLGVLLLAFPANGILSLVWVLGIYGLLYGMSLVAEGFTQRGQEHQVEQRAVTPAAHAA